jgi:hypothetical protein
VISLLEVARSELDQEEWRLISGCLADISEALEVFRPQRNNRKITVAAGPGALTPGRGSWFRSDDRCRWRRDGSRQSRRRL